MEQQWRSEMRTIWQLFDKSSQRGNADCVSRPFYRVSLCVSFCGAGIVWQPARFHWREGHWHFIRALLGFSLKLIRKHFIRTYWNGDFCGLLWGYSSEAPPPPAALLPPTKIAGGGSTRAFATPTIMIMKKNSLFSKGQPHMKNDRLRLDCDPQNHQPDS